MNKRNSIQIYFCIAVLSIISLFWLISSTFRTNIWNGSYQNTDPDSLLFARYLEQSILKGNIQTSDSYSAFPYKIETGFAPPFYMNFLFYSVNAYFSVFPDSKQDPLLVAGWLPVIFNFIVYLLLLIGIYKLFHNKVLTLFCAYFMLPGFSSSMVSFFYKLDYDYLISFYIWSWLICCSFFLKTEKSCFAYIGATITALFISTWNGSPFFYFIVTFYGFILWLKSPKESFQYLSFSAVTMFIGSVVALLFVPRTEDTLKYFLSVNIGCYSYLHGLLVLIGSCFLGVLAWLRRFAKPRTIGLIIIGFIVLLFFTCFHETIFQSTGILLKQDPILANISELHSGFDVKDIFYGNSNDLWLYRVGPIFLIYPLLFCIGISCEEKKSYRLLRDWMFLFFIFFVWQIRYIRWAANGWGLAGGFSAYILWKIIKEKTGSLKYSNFRTCICLLPIMLWTSILNFASISSYKKLSESEIDCFNWLKECTPVTAGYSDDKTPEYGILAYWDNGNNLSFYTKRPVAVSNSLWGYKTMADIFSSGNESEAYELCQKYKMRYIFLEPSYVIPKNILKFWKVFKDMPENPEYKLYYKNFPEDMDENLDYFYFWLSEKCGIGPKGDFNCSDHYRLVYCSDNESNVMSKYIIFECVKGALLDLVVEPESEVSVSLEWKAHNMPFIYKKSTIAAKDGRCTLVLPYSTGNTGKVSTDTHYKMAIIKNGEIQKVELTVPEEYVLEGLTLVPEKHLNYLSTF